MRGRDVGQPGQRAEFDVGFEPKLRKACTHCQLMLSAVDQEHGQFRVPAERAHVRGELYAFGPCSREAA